MFASLGQPVLLPQLARKVFLADEGDAAVGERLDLVRCNSGPPSNRICRTFYAFARQPRGDGGWLSVIISSVARVLSLVLVGLMACGRGAPPSAVGEPDAGLLPYECNANTCANGCCENNTCVPGYATNACGTGGTACAMCTGNQACENQSCEDLIAVTLVYSYVARSVSPCAAPDLAVCSLTRNISTSVFTRIAAANPNCTIDGYTIHCDGAAGSGCSCQSVDPLGDYWHCTGPRAPSVWSTDCFAQKCGWYPQRLSILP